MIPHQIAAEAARILAVNPTPTELRVAAERLQVVLAGIKPCGSGWRVSQEVRRIIGPVPAALARERLLHAKAVLSVALKWSQGWRPH